ncbi:MAG: discoidin domain-containing protein, partial [Candidatus Omnitrophica bacterium]|nr:discoidin domain-containing protein [Candidatus Omnitrophota bacterium]
FGDGVSVNGNAKTSDSQYKLGGGAGSFDGSGDSINLPNSDDWNFGTGDFTIDFQVRFNSPPANNVTFIDRNNSNDFRVSRTNGILTVHLEGTDYAMGAWSPLPEAWYHVAIVRRGSTLFGFINGVELGSTDAPKNIQGTDGIYLGSTSIDTQYLDGMLDEFRISKSIARWTSNFIPPTVEYIPDANTKLLLHMNGFKYDEQSAAYTVDAQGNTTATTTDSLGLVHQEIKDSEGRITFTKDRKVEPNSGFGSVTPNGDAKIINSQAKLGIGSVSLDGNGDYLSITPSDDQNFGSGDFTLDGWINLNTTGTRQEIYHQRFPTNNIFGAYVSPENKLVFHAEVNGSEWATVTGSAVLQAGQWYHVAVIRNGSALKLYVNGAEAGSKSVSGSVASGTWRALIGAEVASNPALQGSYFNGKIDEFRVSKGVARWASNFIPPVQEYTTDDQTKLLLHMNGYKYQTQNFIYDTKIVDGNTTTTVSDSIGILRQETKDSGGRTIYLKERKNGIYEEQWTEYTTVAGEKIKKVFEGINVPQPAAADRILVSEEHSDLQGNLISKKERTSPMNAARGKSVKTSSEYNAAYGAFHVVDGVHSEPGLWFASSMGKDEWAEVDLGKIQSISKIVLDTIWNGDSYVSDFTVKISKDGSTWQTITIQNGLTAGKLWSFEIPDTEARYVRVEGIRGKNGNSPYYGFLRELEVYTSELRAVTTQEIRDSQGKLIRKIETFKEPEELSLGKTAKVTSANNTSTNAPSKALDSDANTFWLASDAVKENAFDIDFGSAAAPCGDCFAEVTQIRVLAQSDSNHLKSFRVLTSPDGVNWQTAAALSGGTASGAAVPAGGKEWIVDITPVEARYVRIDKMEAAQANGNFARDFLTEVRVYGNVSITKESEYDA